jgi:hypothetical protein
MHLQRPLFSFKNPKSESLIISHTSNIENEWPNYNEYVIAMKEEEWDENNIREFIKLIEKHK